MGTIVQIATKRWECNNWVLVLQDATDPRQSQAVTVEQRLANLPAQLWHECKQWEAVHGPEK